MITTRWTMAPMVDDPRHMFDLFRDGVLICSGLVFTTADHCCQVMNDAENEAAPV